jgi:hypothetical protein
VIILTKIVTLCTEKLIFLKLILIDGSSHYSSSPEPGVYSLTRQQSQDDDDDNDYSDENSNKKNWIHLFYLDSNSTTQ